MSFFGAPHYSGICSTGGSIVFFLRCDTGDACLGSLNTSLLIFHLMVGQTKGQSDGVEFLCLLVRCLRAVLARLDRFLRNASLFW